MINFKKNKKIYNNAYFKNMKRFSSINYHEDNNLITKHTFYTFKKFYTIKKNDADVDTAYYFSEIENLTSKKII